MDAFHIAEASKRIYTIPNGEYVGYWQGPFCWIMKPGQMTEVLHRFEVNKKSKGRKKVKVLVEISKVRLYDINHKFI